MSQLIDTEGVAGNRKGEREGETERERDEEREREREIYRWNERDG